MWEGEGERSSGRGSGNDATLNGRLHMTMMIGNETSCAHGLRARTGARSQQAAFTSRKVCALDFCPLAVHLRESPGARGQWRVASACATTATAAARRQVGMPRETRQLLPLYRCGEHVPRKERRKEDRERIIRYPCRSSVRPSVLGKPKERERMSGVSDYGNSSWFFVIS